MKRIWDKYSEIEEKIKSLDFKLCKYYSFDNGSRSFSVQNLSNSQIYFSSPSIFNDPFDSNIGADFSDTFYGHKKTMVKDKIKSLVIEKIITLCLESNNSNIYIDFWREFAAYIDYSVTKSVYFFDLLRYLYFLKSTDKLGQLYVLFQANLNNEYEFIDYLISNDTVEKYLNTKVIVNERIELTAIDYKKCLSSMYKLFGKDKDFKECDYVNEKILKLRHQLFKSINSLFRVSCFCESPLNILMWSHYGDKHRGFCVEYDFRKYFEESGFDHLFCPVVYSNKRISVKLNKKESTYMGYDINLVRALDSLFSKSSAWSYEKEWRKVISNEEDGNPTQKVKISKVFLGCSISKKHEKLIRKICDDMGISVVKVSLDSSFYKLVEIE